MKHAPGTKTGKTAHISLQKLTSAVFDSAVIKGQEDAGPQPIVTFGAGLTYAQLIAAVGAKGLAL